MVHFQPAEREFFLLRGVERRCRDESISSNRGRTFVFRARTLGKSRQGGRTVANSKRACTKVRGVSQRDERCLASRSTGAVAQEDGGR
jgi:hypothetical protein